MNESESAALTPTPQGPDTGPPRFRWRLLPVMYFAFAGGLFSLVAIGHAGTMVYVRLSYGPIEPHPSTPSLNSIAPTLPNLMRLVGASIAGPAGIIAARLWWRGRCQAAIVPSVLCVIGQIAASQFGSFS